MGGNTQKSSSSWNSQTHTDVNPYGPAKPLIDQGLSDLGSAYNQGYGRGVYGGERVPGSLSAQTQAGQGGLDSAAGWYGGLGGTSSAKNLEGIASGGGVNPYYQQMLNNALSQAGSQANSSAAAQGIGSSAQQQQLGTTLGQTAAQAVSDQYNQGVQQQLGANGLIDQQNQNRANTLAGLAGQQIQSGLLNTGLQQAQDAAAMQKFNEEQMAPYKAIGLLSEGINGLAGGYGSSDTTGSGSAKMKNKAGGGLGDLGSLISAGATIAGML